MRSNVLETSSYSKKTWFTLLESWESLGSVAHAACVLLVGKGYCECQEFTRAQKVLREIQRRTIHEDLLNNKYHFQERPLVQRTGNERMYEEIPQCAYVVILGNI